MYYNTNHEKGEMLKASETKAEKQKARILKLFENETVMTRHEVWQALNSPDTPETSVCGRLRDLVKDNKLVKLPLTVRGIYGKQVHQWCNIEFYNSNNHYDRCEVCNGNGKDCNCAENLF